jgi:hypothetical protein
MEIIIDWHRDQFNVNIASAAGREAFLSIKGCRIVQGNDGPFVSYPATRNTSTDKWWRHVWASDKFSAIVLEKAQAPKAAPVGSTGSGFDDMEDSSIPF